MLFIVCRKKNLLRFIYESFETPIFWKLIVCAAINMAHSVAEMGSYGMMDTGAVSTYAVVFFAVVLAILGALAVLDGRIAAAFIESKI